MRLDDLTTDARARVGLDAHMAARRLNVLHDGELSSGVRAFLVLRAQMPRNRLLGRIVGLPGVRQIACAGFDHVLALVVHCLHLRRLRKQHPTT